MGSTPSTLIPAETPQLAPLTVVNIPDEIVLDCVRALARIWEPQPPRTVSDELDAAIEWDAFDSDPRYHGDFLDIASIPLPPEYAGLAGTLGWITITHVCRDLRNLVVEHVPECWARVFGRLPHGDRELLPRARTHPIDVLVNEGYAREFSSEVRNNILNNHIPRNRIRSLTLLTSVVGQALPVNPTTIDSMVSLDRLIIYSAHGWQGIMADEEFALRTFTRPIPRIRCVNYIAHFSGVTHLSIEQTSLGRYAQEHWRVTQSELVGILSALAGTLLDLTLFIAFHHPVPHAPDVARVVLTALRTFQLKDIRPRGYRLPGILNLLRRLLLPADALVAIRATSRATTPVTVEDVRAFQQAGLLAFHTCSVTVAPEDIGPICISFRYADSRLALTVVMECDGAISPVDAADRVLETLSAVVLDGITFMTEAKLPSGFVRQRGPLVPCLQSLGHWSILSYSRPRVV